MNISSVNTSIQNTFDTKVINDEAELINKIKNSSSQKEQLKNVAKEFESIFITKMMSTMEKTIDRE